MKKEDSGIRAGLYRKLRRGKPVHNDTMPIVRIKVVDFGTGAVGSKGREVRERIA